MDIHQRAKERFTLARDAFSETRSRMVEDLHFSNPAEPKQWDEQVRRIRENAADGARPCLTFDQTNQYIAQVVNDSRQNKPSIKVMPVDSKADISVAETLEGVIRHIEYASRAGIAYDTAQEYAARIGLGYMRVLPEVVDPESNLQEIRIKRVHDPLSVTLDPDSTEPDGSDSMFGFVESRMSKTAYEKKYPKKSKQSWDGAGDWVDRDSVRICEYFEITEAKKNMIVAVGPDGMDLRVSEEEYWQFVQQSGFKPEIRGTYAASVRQQKWITMDGAETLEETDFPSIYVPLIPVYGYEIWIEGKRYVCGLTRRMMDAQRSYNYERSSYIEQVALQPKAPFMAAWESIENFEGDWAGANIGNKAYLPYNARDEDGNPLPVPSRQAPPPIPAAFAQGSQMALNDIQASIGMYRANLGAPSNETSGRAIRARQHEGDTANFHYIDNLSRSMEHLGRIVVGMIPKIYDTKRIAKILGDDGSNDMVTIDPNQDQAAVKKGKKVVSINPNVGTYDVRVKVGPAYTTLREEAAANLTDIVKGNPQLMSVLGPVWARMQDWPEADKVSRMLLALAPPQVQEIESGGDEVSPEAQAQIMQLKQTLKQLEQAFHQADEQAQGKQAEAQLEQRKLDIDFYNAQTARLKAEADVALKMQAQAAPDLASEIGEVKMMLLDIMQNAGHLEGVLPPSAPPQAAQPMQDPPQQDMTEQPPQGGFFSPDDSQQ
jgi:hypothetical protein